MSREAMQLALEALEDANDVARMEFSDEDYYSEAINALRQALETEQEPVAWANSFDLQNFDMKVRTGPDLHHTVPLYTAPAKTPTDDGQPVAFINVEKQKLEWAKLTSWHTPTIVNLPKIPLYTAPPKQWVGLTDEEKEKLVETFYGTDIQRLEAVEAKLKEKNT
jgi:hypothetical protein